MLGAIIGDVIGSRFEFHNHFSKEFDLFTDSNTLTDDTICTIAIADCFMNGSEDFATYLRRYCIEQIHAGYGTMFKEWLQDPTMGAYDSWGNGGAMRVSSVAYVVNTMEEAMDMAKRTCMVTHSHPEGIKGAQAVVMAIRLAMKGHDSENIALEIENEFGYDLLPTMADLWETCGEFDVSAKGSVPQAIICALESVSYEDAVRNAVSIGGDSDTIACMAGAIAEIMHGIPDDIKIDGLKRLPVKYIDIVEDFTNKFII